MRTLNATQANATLLARLVPARSAAASGARYRGLAWTAEADDDLLTTGVRWALEDE